MRNILNGIASGLVGTIAAGGMLLMNNALHKIPELHVARTLAALLGSPDRPLVGWVAFLVLGIVVFGVLFALAAPRIPVQSYLVKGLLFGIASWLLMMVVMMPLAGAGLFGIARGTMLAPAALVLNLVYWVVVSQIYRQGLAPERVPARSKA